MPVKRRLSQSSQLTDFNYNQTTNQNKQTSLNPNVSFRVESSTNFHNIIVSVCV